MLQECGFLYRTKDGLCRYRHMTMTARTKLASRTTRYISILGLPYGESSFVIHNKTLNPETYSTKRTLPSNPTVFDIETGAIVGNWPRYI